MYEYNIHNYNVSSWMHVLFKRKDHFDTVKMVSEKEK